MIRLPPVSTRFPCTTLFRSALARAVGVGAQVQDLRLQLDRLEQLVEVRLLRGRDLDLLRLAAQALHHDLALQRSEEHTSELQSRQYLVCRLLLEKKTYI